jgi:hypothetical protein
VTETASGVVFSLDAHAAYSVDVSSVTGYTADNGCSGSNIANATLRACTITISAESATAPLAGGPSEVWYLAAFLAIPRRKRQEEPVPPAA